MKLLNPKTNFIEHKMYTLIRFLPTSLLRVTKMMGLSHTHIHMSVDTEGNLLYTSTHKYEM